MAFSSKVKKVNPGILQIYLKTGAKEVSDMPCL